MGTLDKPEFKDYVMVGPSITGGLLGLGVGVGLRKGETELKKSFEDAIQAAIKDGTVKNLSLKWFKIDISPQGLIFASIHERRGSGRAFFVSNGFKCDRNRQLGRFIQHV